MPLRDRAFHSPWLRYGVALAAVLGSWGLRHLMTPLWGTSKPFIFFFAGIVLSTWFGRFGPGLLTMALSTLIADWFYIEPLHSSFLLYSHDRMALLAFIAVGLTLIFAIESMHRANSRARRELEERKKTEEARARSEQTFIAMFRSLPVGVTLARISDGRFVDVNEAFSRLTRYSREELIGHTSADLGMVQNLERRQEILAQVRRDGFASSIELRIHPKAGDARHVLSNSALIELQGDKYILSSTLDVTDTKRADERVRQLNVDLDRRVRERTRELEAFTYTVAHDLRAPLRAMQGFADVVLMDAAPRLEPIEREYLGRIGLAATRMDRLVNDLLAYSRLGLAEIAPEAIDLNLLVKEVLVQLGLDLRERRAEVTVEPGLPTVLADRTSLFQVVMNLVSNAAKFVSPDVEPRIRISALKDSSWVRLSVEDNGIGIDQQYRAKLFNVFERLHGSETYPGTGIGLAIVRRAIERMGGRVGLTSVLGQGSCFWFELPESRVPEPSPPPAAAQAVA